MSATQLVVTFGDDGGFEAIYDDDLLEALRDLGSFDVTRASHVEPHDGGWIADMAPVQGPVLYSNGESWDMNDSTLVPFETRAAALAAEVKWLREERGL
jgi:hypothetical protein